MNRRHFCILPVALVIGWFWTPSAAAGPEAAVGELARRLLGDRAAAFVFEPVGQEAGRDVFEIETAGDKIVIRGSGGVAMASGLGWYLKHHCHCQVSFNGDQLALPPTLPAVSPKVRRVSPFRYRYSFNYCAFSYTMAWWDWPQWQRMIDWMALHGINMPLAMTGQEAVWQKVYRDLGLDDDEIGRFFVGPGYLPFGWMGCIDQWQARCRNPGSTATVNCRRKSSPGSVNSE
jgi:alpha-N-acetylglucosaminidase